MEARTLKATIAEINATQVKSAINGAKALVIIISNQGIMLVSSNSLEEILGPAYDAICVTALDAIDVQLALAKTAAQKALASLAETTGHD